MEVGAVVLVGLSGVLALWFAWKSALKVLSFKVEVERMEELSRIINRSAMAFLRREYTVLIPFVLVVAGVLAWKVSYASAVCFAVGASLSGLAGWVGMSIATRANGKTSFAATMGVNRALEIAFSGGTVMGMSVVGLGILGITALYLIFRDATLVTSFGFGASSIALFARVGGGIYTKAADVGADLVGKVEAGIPEDDPRNPAVIADNVGDNVGDIAGMGADLFESYVNSIIAAMSVGAVVFGARGVVYPLLLAGLGIVAAAVGTYFVKIKDESSDPQKALQTGNLVTGALVMGGAFVLTPAVMGDMKLFWAVVSGVVAGVAIGYVTEYFTSSAYSHVRRIAEASLTGPATNLIMGISVGMYSTSVPTLLIAAATFLSYKFGGLYGIACAAVGMLSITGMTLSVDAYGPIADNAGGIAEMSHMPPEVRRITDRLDAIGNTTAAIGKGLAIGSAALTALSLFAAYATATGLKAIDLMDARVMAGALVGGMLPFLFSSFALQAVGRAAYSMVEEVRRQFREIEGLLEGKASPDYERCVDISTRAALREMVIPGLMAVLAPLAVGYFMGPAALGGMLGGSIVSGVMLAIFMANAGGAWDNAKKYIEEGHYGGKKTPPHAAAVVGDTVGDPFKDTAGPSLNILIKLMSIIAVVFAPFMLG